MIPFLQKIQNKIDIEPNELRKLSIFVEDNLPKIYLPKIFFGIFLKPAQAEMVVPDKISDTEQKAIGELFENYFKGKSELVKKYNSEIEERELKEQDQYLKLQEKYPELNPCETGEPSPF